MKIDYKLKTENEDVKYYNKKVTKLGITYKLRINIPYWIDASYLFDLFPVRPKKGEDVTLVIADPFEEGNGINKRKNYIITFNIHTTTKCNDDDKFDETIGLHICETKAEIKALEIVNKFIVKIRENLKLDDSIFTNLNSRLSKNYSNLDKLCE